jgi:hypothetical protein
MTANQPRVAVHASDPPEVFLLEAELLTRYRDIIESAVADISARFPEPESAARAFIARIGSDIPDATIRAAVKRLATIKFRQCRIEAN